MKKTSSRAGPVDTTPKSGNVLVSGQAIVFELTSGAHVAFDNEIACGIYTPAASVPDDHAEEYRKAPGTCGVWVSGALKREMSPAEIGRFTPVRGAMDERPGAQGQETVPSDQTAEQKYNSLASALDGWFGNLLAELPKDLRNRVEGDPFLRLWDTLSDDHRRIRAAEWDYKHDPALEAKRRCDWHGYVTGWEEHWKKVPLFTAVEFCSLRRIHDPRNFDDERSYIPEGESKPLGELLDDDLRIIGRGANQSSTKPLAAWISTAGRLGLEVPGYLRGAAVESRETATEEDQADSREEQPASAARECDVFRSMGNLSAGELTLTFVADGRLLEIAARGVTRRVPLANLELEDRRSSVMNYQCAVLLGIAQERRVLYSPKMSQTISRLRRRVFNPHLGVSDPFDIYRKTMGWEARFKVVDKRDAADERAKREAERRTDSYEEMKDRALFESTRQDFGHENDPAGRWIDDHPNE